jgi:predicted Zn finger-like uncharacterized protein
MYTQCPHCLTLHTPTATQLALGRGSLRCGVCEREFDALERLSDGPVGAQSSYVRGRVGDVPRVEPELEGGSRQRGASPAGAGAPTFLRGSRRALEPAGNGRWWAGVAALGLLLCAQIVLAQRAELAEDAGLRPWLVRVCKLAGCELPPWRAPEQLRLQARDIRPHPSVPGALLITATFRNEALWPQAWPMLELTLADLDGRLVALRRFPASEYLGAEPEGPVLGVGQSVAVELEVRDPGKEAIAFEFDFL